VENSLPVLRSSSAGRPGAGQEVGAPASDELLLGVADRIGGDGAARVAFRQGDRQLLAAAVVIGDQVKQDALT